MRGPEFLFFDRAHSQDDVSPAIARDYRGAKSENGCQSCALAHGAGMEPVAGPALGPALMTSSMILEENAGHGNSKRRVGRHAALRVGQNAAHWCNAGERR